MNLVILIGLTVIGILHAIRGGASLLGVGLSATQPSRKRAMLPLAGVALSIVGLLVGWSAALPLPVGYAGGAGGLLLDPLGCVFALLLFVVASWCDAAEAEDGSSAGLRDLRTASILLAVLAGDAFLLACGACLAMLLPSRLLGRRGARRAIGAGFAVAGACTLLSGIIAPVGQLLADPGFALLRAGGGAATVLLPVLVLLGCIPVLGLWPATGGFRHQAAFAPVWVPITGTILGQFLLTRLVLDLAGPVASWWWGGLVIALGIGSAIGAGASGLSERRASGVLGSILAAQNGLVLVAAGLCMLARADDLPALAGTASDTVLLMAPVSVLGGLTAVGLARAMEGEAGSGLLSRLGGLVRSMPMASGLMLLPAFLLGAVPPLAGFSTLWLLVQLVLATPLPMLGGVAVVSLLLVLCIAATAVLNAAGLLRLCWIVVLGRPRTPRGAAATDLARPVLRLHLAVLGLPLLIGLIPGIWLRLAAGQEGTGADAPRRAAFWLDAPAGNAILSPLPITVLLCLCTVVVLVFARTLAVRTERRQRGWEDGLPPPPPWLPFGDPATQIAPATLAMALRQALDPNWLRSTGGRLGLPARLRGASSRWSGVWLPEQLARHGTWWAAAVLALVLCAMASGLLAAPGSGQ